MILSPKTHWVVLRLTAAAAIPLCVWLILNIVGLIGAPYEVFTAWLKNPLNAGLMILLIVVTFYHAMLGIHEILEDYVHNKAMLKLSMTLKTLSFIAVGAVCVYAIIKVAFMGE